MADGSIVFNTELDNKKLEQDLARLTRKIESLEDKAFRKKREQMPLVEQSRQLGAELDAAKAKLEYMKSGQQFFTSAHTKEQEAAVAAMQGDWDRVQNKVEKYDADISGINIDLERQKEKAGAIAQKLSEAGSAGTQMGEAVKRANKHMSTFGSRLASVVRSALIFTVVSQALAKFRDWMGKVIQSNAEASVAVARLKGALLTLVQPLVSVIIPAFTFLVDVLTQVVTAIARVMALLFGGTISQSKDAAKALDKETSALEGTGAAAKEAGGELAGFDEVNQIPDSSGGAGGGSGKASSAPLFDFDTSSAEGNLDKILSMAKLVGAALLAWKLSSSLKDGIVKFIGFFLALDGAIGFAKSTFDAWVNGVNWENFLGMLGRAAELVAGLWLALGPIAGAIGMIVSGLTMLATAFHDADLNGWNLQNTLLAIAGILATGIGIALLVGSWIPALIAAIAAALLAIVTVFGDGEKLIADAKLILQGFLDFFVGIFTGDIERAMKGIGAIFEGLKGIVGNVLDSLKNMLFSFLDWLDEKTGGKLSGIIQVVKNLLGGVLDWMKESFGHFADSFQEIFEGIVTFLSGVFSGNWDQAWEGLVGIVKGAVNLLISLVESFVNFFVNGLNTLIKALNKISFTPPEGIPIIGGKKFGINIPPIPDLQIPRLAAGAVIPPNREFMAVLGDQRSGTNIEAPESLIRKILREELGGADGQPKEINITVVTTLDGKEVARNQVKHINNMTRSAGKPVLLF